MADTNSPSRRDMVKSAAALLAITATASAQQSQSPASDSHPQNKAGGPPPTNAGPENPELIKQNPNSWSPPATDSGDVNNFRYPFAFGHNRVAPGAGWARQVTVRDLAISKTMAGVNMRLEPGAIRELHCIFPPSGRTC